MDLNQQMCAFALARLDAMGERDGGLYNYYIRLASNGTMLRDEEHAVAAYIERIAPPSILELAAGAAQLGHMLSLAGYATAASEIDPRRAAFARALGEHVGSKCDVLFGRWQGLPLSKWNLLVTLNAASSMISPADVRLIREHVLGGGQVIIRPRQFGAVGVDADIQGLKATKVLDDVYHYTA